MNKILNPFMSDLALLESLNCKESNSTVRKVAYDWLLALIRWSRWSANRIALIFPLIIIELFHVDLGWY